MEPCSMCNPFKSDGRLELEIYDIRLIVTVRESMAPACFFPFVAWYHFQEGLS